MQAEAVSRPEFEGRPALIKDKRTDHQYCHDVHGILTHYYSVNLRKETLRGISPEPRKGDSSVPPLETFVAEYIMTASRSVAKYDDIN